MIKFVSFLLVVLMSFPAKAQVSFAPLVEKVLPSVVSISTRLEEMPDKPDVINSLLFETPDGRAALGAGFVVGADGYIATNRHVIEHGRQISVTTADNSVYEATIVGIDRRTDIALLKIDAGHDLTPVEYGDSDQVRVGDRVLVVGNPYGLNNSVASGIVSAKSRDIGDGLFDDYIQTDAAVNQGNSGGPMFDVNGRLIGMNTAIFSDSGFGRGIGFALPVGQVSWVVDQIRQNGKVERSSLGVVLKKTRSVDGSTEFVVTSLLPTTASAQSVLQVGDVILKSNLFTMDTVRSVSEKTARLPAGSEIVLTIRRNDEISDLSVRTVPLLDVPVLKVSEKKFTDENVEGGRSYPKYGFILDGVNVIAVQDGSQAEHKGIKAGDKIVRVENKLVGDERNLAYYLNDAQMSGTSVRLDLTDQKGEAYFVELTVESEENNDQN